MRKVKRWLEKAYERRNTEELDTVVIVIGDEGAGKSTFMVQCKVIWKVITGQADDMDAVDSQEVLDEIVWGERDEYRQALEDRPPRTAVPVMDAAHALYRREATHPDEIAAEKDLLDARFKEHLLLLGFQDFGDVPKILAERRAHFAFHLPFDQGSKKGLLRGYGREALDERWESGEWPEADLRDRFPSLEGTELWTEYKRRDRERKRARMGVDENGDDGESPADKTDLFAIAEQIKNDGLENVVSVHGGHNKKQIDQQLIEVQHDLSRNDASKVKKLLVSDPGVDPADVNLEQ
jgi:hypothetical protein